MKYINIFYTGYRINNSPSLPPPLPVLIPPHSNALINYCNIVIYCTRAGFHFHVMFDVSIVYHSCHIFRVVSMLYYHIYILCRKYLTYDIL